VAPLFAVSSFSELSLSYNPCWLVLAGALSPPQPPPHLPFSRRTPLLPGSLVLAAALAPPPQLPLIDLLKSILFPKEVVEEHTFYYIFLME